MTDRTNDTGKRRKPSKERCAKEASGNSNEKRRRRAELEKKSFQGISIYIPPNDGSIEVSIGYSFDQATAVTRAGNFVSMDLSAIDERMGDICDIINARVPHFRGRPRFPNTLEIVDAAAKIRAEGGKYTWIARKSGLTPKQLQDRVHTHKARFNQKVAEYTAAKKT
jgi:hypothetical protein